MTTKIEASIKQALLDGSDYQSANGWVIRINASDCVEIWPPKGAGKETSLSYLDRAIKDFCKQADVYSPSVNETQGKPSKVTDGDLGKDTSTKDTKKLDAPEKSPRPKPKGPFTSTGLGSDSSSKPGFSEPAINKRPKGENWGLGDTELGEDSSGRSVNWGDKKVKIKEDGRTGRKRGQFFGSNRRSYGFFLSLGDSMWEDNAREDGWDVNDPLESDNVTEAAIKVEDNVISWMRNNLGNVRAEGHNSEGELAGTIFVDEKSGGIDIMEEVIENGEPLSTGKGDFPFDPTEGVEDKYARLFSVSLDFVRDEEDGRTGNKITDTFANGPDPSEIYRNLRATRPSKEMLEDIMDPDKWVANRVFAQAQDSSGVNTQYARNFVEKLRNQISESNLEEDDVNGLSMWLDTAEQQIDSGNIEGALETLKNTKKQFQSVRKAQMEEHKPKRGPGMPGKGKGTYADGDAGGQLGAGCGGDVKAVAPEGWEDTVKKMKKQPGIDNPWALAWSMKNKGYTPGGKDKKESKRAQSLDEFTLGYMEAALWSSGDPEMGYESFDSFDFADIDDYSRAHMISDCAKFQEENAADLDIYYETTGRDAGSAGHDFWLTRYGHGTGFWDRDGDEEALQRLTASSKKFGEEYLYLGDDEKLYIDGHEGPREASHKQAGPKLREKWMGDGGYHREIESESAEELHALVRGFSGEEVDWSPFKPSKPDKDADNSMEPAAQAPSQQNLTAGKQAWNRKDFVAGIDYWNEGHTSEEVVEFLVNRGIDSSDASMLVGEIAKLSEGNDPRVAQARSSESDVEAVDEKAKETITDYFGEYGKELTKGDGVDKKKPKKGQAEDVYSHFVPEHMEEIKEWADSQGFDLSNTKSTQDRGHYVWRDQEDGRALVVDIGLLKPKDEIYLGLGLYDPQVFDGKVPVASESFGYTLSTGERWAKRAQADTTPPATPAPSTGTPSVSQNPQQPSGAKPPVPADQKKGPITQQTPMQPGVGDAGVQALGWTQQDVQSMTDEQKQKILQVGLTKPGTQPKTPAPGAQKPTQPTQPAKPTQQTQPTQAPVQAPGSESAPAAPSAPAPKATKGAKKVTKKRSQAAPVAPPESEEGAPATPQPGPANPPQKAPSAPGGANPTTKPHADAANSVEQQAFQILQEVQKQPVEASSANEIATAKTSLLIQRLSTEIGMGADEASKLFGLPRGNLSSLFK